MNIPLLRQLFFISGHIHNEVESGNLLNFLDINIEKSWNKKYATSDVAYMMRGQICTIPMRVTIGIKVEQVSLYNNVALTTQMPNI
jgi:hypothetical protein